MGNVIEFELPYKQGAHDKPSYYDKNGNLYNNAFINPETIRFQKKLRHSFIYKTYGTDWKPFTGEVEVNIDIRCRKRCNLLPVGKNIIDSLHLGCEKTIEQVIEDDKQIISAVITQQYSKRDVISVTVKHSATSGSDDFSNVGNAIAFKTALEPCEIILPEFRRTTDTFTTSSKNETAIQRHVDYLYDNYPDIVERRIFSPCRLVIDVCTRCKRKDLDNIAILIMLAIQRAAILPEPKYVKAVELNLKRVTRMDEYAAVKLILP